MKSAHLFALWITYSVPNWKGIRPACNESPWALALRIPQLSPTQGTNTSTSALCLCIFTTQKRLAHPPLWKSWVSTVTHPIKGTEAVLMFTAAQLSTQTQCPTGEEEGLKWLQTNRIPFCFWSFGKSKAHSLYFSFVFLKGEEPFNITYLQLGVFAPRPLQVNKSYSF